MAGGMLNFLPPPHAALSTGMTAASARAAVRELTWEAPADVRDRAVLAVSELVQNAINQGVVCTLAAWHSAGQRGLRVEVDDDAPGDPIVRDRLPETEGGFGLRIVDSVVDRWGVERLPAERKRVWFEIEYP